MPDDPTRGKKVGAVNLIASAMGGEEPNVVAQQRSPRDTIQLALKTVREHLGMEVAYISDLSGDEWVLLAVDNAPGAPDLGGVGARLEKERTFCHHTALQSLPAVLPVTQANALAKSLTDALPFPIGSHIAVPLSNPGTSEPYGMFCCFSAEEDRTLQERDRGIMEAFAAVSAEALRQEVADRERVNDASAMADLIRQPGGFIPHFQPIFDLNSLEAVGVEALARFNTNPARPPNLCFDVLDAAGRRNEVELDVIVRAADVGLGHFERFVGLNLSPQAILDERFAEVMNNLPLSRLVLEVTEHAPVEDYPRLVRTLQTYRSQGLRLAVDDAGGGYASLNHVLRLAPDIIKTDRALIHGIDKDAARQALVSALVAFAERTNACLLAEGIETEAELRAVRELGVDRAQGFFLGRPVPIKVLDETLQRGEEILARVAAGAPNKRLAAREKAPAGPAGVRIFDVSLAEIPRGGDPLQVRR